MVRILEEIVTCDLCGSQDYRGEPGSVRSAGWRVFRVGDTIERHACPDCLKDPMVEVRIKEYRISAKMRRRKSCRT